MSKCKCDFCQCETEEDYLKLFFKEVGDILKKDYVSFSGNIIDDIRYHHDSLSEFICELLEDTND